MDLLVHNSAYVLTPKVPSRGIWRSLEINLYLHLYYTTLICSIEEKHKNSPIGNREIRSFIKALIPECKGVYVSS